MVVKIECSVNEKLIDKIDFLRRWERQTGSYKYGYDFQCEHCSGEKMQWWARCCQSFRPLRDRLIEVSLDKYEALVSI